MGRIYYRYIDRQIKNDRKLITNVKYFPVIYDVKDPSYHNRLERKRIWEEVAQTLKTTAKKCEERWHKLIEMYISKTSHLHDALLEIMDQFLNMQTEPNGNINVPYEDQGEAVGLSSEDSEQQIDLEQLICSEFMDDTLDTSLSDTESCLNNNNKSQSHSTFTDNFFDVEDELELYQDSSHSV